MHNYMNYSPATRKGEMLGEIEWARAIEGEKEDAGR